MKVSVLTSNVRKIVMLRNIFIGLSFLLSLALVLLICLLFKKSERIVILPTTGSSLWIENNAVSDSYLEKMGSHISDLLLTRTEADVDRKNKQILDLVHPELYHSVKKQLLLDKENIQKHNQTLFFRLERGYIDSFQKAYIAEGELLVFIGKLGENPSCIQREKKRFVFGFECQSGKLLLKSLKKENFS